MLPTHLKQWEKSKIKQFNTMNDEALLFDEPTLLSFSQDFGKLIQAKPSAVFLPQSINAIQSLINFANQEQLTITIRGNGLSQGGQALAVPGGVILSMQQFNKALDLESDTVWVEANCSWANLLERTLPQKRAPYVVPYNCNLSVAGVLSAGGVGASSFKYGTLNAHVAALEVVDGRGELQIIHPEDPLFHACLSGQGRCAVITKAQIKLKPIKAKVKTYCLVYTEQNQWFADIERLKQAADYMELFCSPSMQGARLVGDKRMPMAQWLYGLHCSFEFDDYAPELKGIKPWQLINEQEESIQSYFLRHNSRFEVMKNLGQWELLHPWYECFVPTQVLEEQLGEVLQSLPLHYATTVHIAPVSGQRADFLMAPEQKAVTSFMILNPGVPEVLKDSCLQAIKHLDDRFLAQGGKRYLSGFLGTELSDNYWAQHFADKYSSWMDLKRAYDPAGVFSSVLHRVS